MTKLRSFSAIGLGLALTFGAGACGGQPFPTSSARSGPSSSTPATIVDAGQPPRARLLAAVQRVTAEKTARIALSMSVSATGTDAGDVSLSGAGIIDIPGRRMQMTVTTTGDDSSTGELRLVGGTLYVRDTEDSNWLKIPAGSAAETRSVTPDPTSYLDYLQGVADDVHVAGTELVRGVPTTKYSATIDLARALAHATSPAQRSTLAGVSSVFGGLKIPTSVWVDDLGQFRKMQLSLDLGAVATKMGLPAGSDPVIDMTLELYDFGVAVDVQAPAGAQDEQSASQDRAAQSDLRNALTAEKTVYTDNQTYSADPATMREIEPSLGWGTTLTVAVGEAGGQPLRVVCLAERSRSGTTFALLDVGTGPVAGTYYARHGCPAVVNEATVSTFTRSW